MNERIALNKRRSRILGASFWSLVFVISTLIFSLLSMNLIVGAVIGAIIATAWTVTAWLQAGSVVLDLCDVDDANIDDHARLFNVVNGLRAAMGLPPLDLYVVHDPAINALALGRDPHNAALIVTQGLLNETTLVELESAIALELYKIKTHATAAECFVIPTFGASIVLAESADRYDWLNKILSAPTSLVNKVIAKVHSNHNDIETDIESTLFTRYPPALAAILTKMAGQSAPAVAAPITAHLWMAPPLAPSAHPTAIRLHAPLTERVAVLQEL